MSILDFTIVNAFMQARILEITPFRGGFFEKTLNFRHFTQLINSKFFLIFPKDNEKLLKISAYFSKFFVDIGQCGPKLHKTKCTSCHKINNFHIQIHQTDFPIFMRGIRPFRPQSYIAPPPAVSAG